MEAQHLQHECKRLQQRVDQLEEELRQQPSSHSRGEPADTLQSPAGRQPLQLLSVDCALEGVSYKAGLQHAVMWSATLRTCISWPIVCPVMQQAVFLWCATTVKFCRTLDGMIQEICGAAMCRL